MPSTSFVFRITFLLSCRLHFETGCRRADDSTSQARASPSCRSARGWGHGGRRARWGETCDDARDLLGDVRSLNDLGDAERLRLAGTKTRVGLKKIPCDGAAEVGRLINIIVHSSKSDCDSASAGRWGIASGMFTPCPTNKSARKIFFLHVI